MRSVATSKLLGALLLIPLMLMLSLKAYAAETIPAGTVVLDMGAGTVTYPGSEPQAVVGSGTGPRAGRCRIDQSDLDLLEFSSNSSRSEQRGSWGSAGTPQGCAFMEAIGEEFVSLGSGIGGSAKVVGFDMRFIVVDDAVFELEFFDGTTSVATKTVATGRSEAACSADGEPVTSTNDTAVFFPCVAQSNPNSAFDFQVREGQENGTVLEPSFVFVEIADFTKVVVRALEGSVGVTYAALDLGLTATLDDPLTCTNDDPGTTILESFDASNDEDSLDDVFDLGGAVCRRLPDRIPGSAGIAACEIEGVAYSLDASCDAENPSDCSVTFIHGDQEGVPRDAFAFLCEVWWPARPGNFTAGEPILKPTEVYWGGLTTPLARGEDATFGEGITPVFQDSCSPLEFQLSSEDASVTDGLAVSPSGCSRSLLGAYEDVLLPEPDPIADDQCPDPVAEDDPQCPEGVQRIFVIDQRDFQVEDDDAVPHLSDPGRLDGDATSKYRRGERYVIEGDIRLRSF